MKSTILVSLMLVVFVGCTPSPKSGKGFTLPEGNLEQGKATFVRLQCNACHQIDGIEQLAVDGEDPAASVALGGEVARIKTYGELVTSIINPSHRLARGYSEDIITGEDGESKMPKFNDVMTVTELTDLVAFLQSKYKLFEYEPTDYPMYSL